MSDKRALLHQWQEANERIKRARSDPEANEIKLDELWQLTGALLVALAFDEVSPTLPKQGGSG